MKRVQRVFGDIDALRYVDGRLNEDRRSAFQTHLAGDPDLSNRVQLWGRQNDALRSNFSGVSAEPVPLWLRLDQLGPEREGAGGGPSAPGASVARLARFTPPNSAARPSGRLRAMAVAVFLVAVGGVSILAAHTLLPAPIAPVDDGAVEDGSPARASDAFRAFALDPARPVELTAADQPALERWLSHRVGIPVRAPDLRDSGWTLLGGRVTPGDTGPAAFLVYDGGVGQRLGLYIAPAGMSAARDAVVAPMPDGSTLSWSSGAASYVVAAGKDQAWMTWNAAALKGKLQAVSAARPSSERVGADL